MILYLFLILSIYSNPYSVITTLDLLDYSGEEYYELGISVRSISKTKGKYLFRVNLPEELEIIEGKTKYRDELKGLGQKNYSIVINPLKEFSSNLRVTVYSYKNDWSIDTNNKRVFISECLAKKLNDSKLVLKISDAIEKKRSNIIKQIQVNDNESSEPIENKEEEFIEKNESKQKFLFIRKAKSLNVFRYILLGISLLIIGYFIYRLRKK